MHAYASLREFDEKKGLALKVCSVTLVCLVNTL